MTNGFLVHYENVFGNDCISRFVTTKEEGEIEIARINSAFPRINKFYTHNPKPWLESWVVEKGEPK